MASEIHQDIGEAWLALAAELQEHLRADDPQAQVEATVAPSGLLQLDVRTIAGQRASARALARGYEEHAASLCERCGVRITVAGAGPVVTILCAQCSTEAQGRPEKARGHV
jgi:hypothetical protein